MKKLKELFNRLELEFPYGSMSPDFRGSHSITSRGTSGDNLMLSVWSKGRAFHFYFDQKDLDNLDLFMIEIHQLIERSIVENH